MPLEQGPNGVGLTEPVENLPLMVEKDHSFSFKKFTQNIYPFVFTNSFLICFSELLLIMVQPPRNSPFECSKKPFGYGRFN